MRQHSWRPSTLVECPNAPVKHLSAQAGRLNVEDEKIGRALGTQALGKHPMKSRLGALANRASTRAADPLAQTCILAILKAHIDRNYKMNDFMVLKGAWMKRRLKNKKKHKKTQVGGIKPTIEEGIREGGLHR